MHRILVIRAGQLGDTVWASSIIDPLRERYGEAVRIDWVAKAGPGGLFARDPRIRRVFELTSRRKPLLFNAGKRALVRQSWIEPYDLLVNLEMSPIFNTMIRLTRARRKIGRPYGSFPEPPGTHVVERLHLAFESFLGPSIISRAHPRLIGSPADEIRTHHGLAPRYVVLVPANSHTALPRRKNHRSWPIRHWKGLMEGLGGRDRQVVIVGGKSDRGFLDELKPYPPNVLDIAGKTDLRDLVGIVAGADALVSTDTGPAHIAAAVGTPVFVLMGPTHPGRTAPYRTPLNEVHLLSAHLECSPCYHTPRYHQCPEAHCMRELDPQRVLAALDECLRAAPNIVATPRSAGLGTSAP